MEINKKCQVFTPEENVQQLLDNVGYRRNLYNRKVAENSCGDGNILSVIVIRYIEDCLTNKISKSNIKKGLEEDIYGAEIDEEHIKNCIIKLNCITEKYGIKHVNWNIYQGDFLKLNLVNKFDFVIGNPPYISYLELSNETRAFLRENYSICKNGKFDYCYAFIQAGINALTIQGRLAYLIPGNIFKNQFASALRELMLPRLTDIYDYTNLKLFKNKLTSSAIIVYDNTINKNYIVYHDMVNNNKYNINKSSLTEKWKFERNTELNNEHIRFGDVFHAASSVATLLNKVFIIDKYKCEDIYLRVGDQKIEMSILRRAVSPRSLNYKKDEFVIFPYRYYDGKLIRFSETEFEESFPFATQYLLSYKSELDNRNSDKGIKWFEYGRSQALAHLNQEKLLTSTLITKEVKSYMLDAHTIPTSGLYIISKGIYDLKTAKKILDSPEFLEYVKKIGVISNGNSFRISPKDINEYHFLYSKEMLVNGRN
ncbi:MAG: Eco57I restriction-modification methylase domain-containing protein [Oscillospiraceae bacterium]